MALSKPTPPIETTSLAEAGRDLGLVFDRVNSAGTHVVVEDADGQPIGAIVSLDDLRALQEAERCRAWKDLHAVMNDMASAFSDLSAEEGEQLVADEISAYKAERRATRS